MRTSRREAVIPWGLSVVAFVLAFAQRPGLASTDTKINLQVDPGRFLSDVASMWTSTGQLGDVQTGQYSGYLFPMGPFFAVGHGLGLSAWVVQRLWLGTLLALGAWGTVRLLDALLGRPRGTKHLVAGVLTILNPFVVTYANRTTVTLLAYVALPWLLLVVHRGLEDRGPGSRWRWPVAFALVLAASGGGVNAAVVAWMLLGPVLLLLYEWRFVPIPGSRARAFALRAAPLSVLVSLWWLIPIFVQTSFGIDFLPFTEQPGTVWGTTSVTEALRLMSYWLSYVGIGFAGHAIPYFDDAPTLLFSVPVVLATLLLPAAALGGFAWTRRWRYGPFFLTMALLGVLVMFAGFPDGTGLRHGLYFIYNRVPSVRFLRASDKAAPLLALALACLGGAGAGELWRRLGALRGARGWRIGAAIAAAAAITLASWPMVTGRAQDGQTSFRRVPAAWLAAAAGLDRTLPVNSRAIVLPGDLFAFYRWGGTVDPILPVLSRRPVAERTEVPYADLRATDLLWTIDSLVHQQRLLPGQLAPLLGLIGVRQVFTATDSDLARSDAPAPADVAGELTAQPGFARPARSYGPFKSFRPTGLGPAISLPQVRRYDLPAARGLIRIEPRAAPTVVDGSAAGLASLAAFGELPGDRALLYSGDLTPTGLHAALAGGGELAITDSNRRRAFVVGSLEQNSGPSLTPGETLTADGYDFDPFGRGSDFETVARYTGVSLVQAPSSPETPQFPEHAPFAAIDGSAETAWLADPSLAPADRWLQVDFTRPRAVPYVDLLPYDDAGGSVRQVNLAGRTFAVHPGWNRLRLGQSPISALRVTLTEVSRAQPGARAGAGGISELRIPGVHAHEELRLPVDAARALSGRLPPAVRLLYLFSRTTGDGPYRRDLAHGPWSAFAVHTPGDGEQTMARSFTVPAARRFTASSWVSMSPQAGDDSLDRLAGYGGPVRATSSSRFDGAPQWRASGALDGNPATAWISDYRGSTPAWIQWRLAQPISLASMRLTAPRQLVRRPTAVRVLWPGGSTAALPVGPAGAVQLPRPVRARTFRLEILAAAVPAGASPAERRAVGIAEIEGISGLPRVGRARAGAFVAPCGSARVRIEGQIMALRVTGTQAAFEQGTPLRASSCGAPVALSAGAQQLIVAPGQFAVDELRLSSGPAPIAAPSGAVVAPGTSGQGSYDHVHVTVSRPSWLVLGESYNRGWEAWCDGRALGAPVPIDGYGNGWPVAPGCHSVRLAFGPSRLARIGYVVSALAVLGCLLLLGMVAWRRRRRAPAPPAPASVAPRATPRAASRVRVVLATVVAAVAFGFTFGVGAGAGSLVVIAVVRWRGIGAARLALGAGMLLGIVVPLLYLIEPGDPHGGNHYGYAAQHIDAHWVGVAAVGLLMMSLWRALRPFPDAVR